MSAIKRIGGLVSRFVGRRKESRHTALVEWEGLCPRCGQWHRVEDLRFVRAVELTPDARVFDYLAPCRLVISLLPDKEHNHGRFRFFDANPPNKVYVSILDDAFEEVRTINPPDM